MNRVMTYIEENLDGEICCEEAARAACCSSFYFQRMFSWVMGISFGEYVRRRRMSQAALDLQQKGARVSDIALKYGYASPTSFNRAFQSVHGIAPAAAGKGALLRSYPPARFSVELTGERALRYRITERDAIRIAGIRIALTEDMDENRRIVPQFWQEAQRNGGISRIGGLAGGEIEGLLGVSVYEDPRHIFYYIAVSTEEEAPSGMYEYTIPAGTWAVFEQEGDFRETAVNIFRRFYTEWLLLSDYTYGELPDIEVYPLCQKEPGKGHLQVWISVRRADRDRKEKKERK